MKVNRDKLIIFLELLLKIIYFIFIISLLILFCYMFYAETKEIECNISEYNPYQNQISLEYFNGRCFIWYYEFNEDFGNVYQKRSCFKL